MCTKQKMFASSFILYYVQLAAAVTDIGLNTVELIESHGYFPETHHITTEDGYILTYHRVLNEQTSKCCGKKPAVLLMHGIIASSADFVNMGPKRSLAYILTDSGYDVWIANARGNAWSRNHTTLNPDLDSKQFYDFSWHEIGYYDIPAAIDYILAVNGDANLYYVGHSQGCTAFLVAASTRPEYNKKIRLASLMAPASFMENPSPLLKGISRYVYAIEAISKMYEVYEIPFTGEFRMFLSVYCQLKPDICSEIFGQLGGNAAQDRLPVIYTNIPSNTALKQFFHYLQLMQSGGFVQYDYGPVRNKKIYGRENPASYDLSKISAPVAIYYSKSDRVINYKNTQKLIKKLPNVVHTQIMTNGFEHTDYITAKNVVNVVYKELVSIMLKY